MEYPSQPLTVHELTARMQAELDVAGARIPAPRLGCDTAIAHAAQAAEIGAEPPLRPWQGVTRPIARAAARAVLYLSRFITDAQIRFNRQIVAVLATLNQWTLRLDARLSAHADQADQRLVEVERALWRLRLEVGALQRPTSSNVASQPPSSAGALDALYAALEDRFRGSRDEIKERLRVYLPLLRDAYVQAGDDLLDVGCGRGEWLELLREHGFRARGVDSNGTMTARCRALDLEVVHSDAIAFLRTLPPGGTALVTAFHVAEHLPFPVLVALFDEAARVLRRDGLLVIETPNPDDPRTVTRDFYLDPTHRHPLPAALLTFLAETTGFDRISILPLDTARSGLDYALVARKA